MKVIDGFSEKMRNLREKAGLTQKQFAAQIGVSKSVVSQYELQERMPSPFVLIKIASVFHVSTDYLLGIDKKNRLDISELDEKETEIVENLVKFLIENKKK